MPTTAGRSDHGNTSTIRLTKRNEGKACYRSPLGATSSHVAAREIRCEKAVLSNLGLLGTAESCQLFRILPRETKTSAGSGGIGMRDCAQHCLKNMVFVCFCTTSVSCLCVEFNQPFPNWEQHISDRRVSITKGRFDCPRFEPVHFKHFQTHAFILK